MKNYDFRNEVLQITSEERRIIRGNYDFIRLQISSILFAVERGVSVKDIAEYWDIVPATVKRRIRKAVADARREIRSEELKIIDAEAMEKFDKAIIKYNAQFECDACHGTGHA